MNFEHQQNLPAFNRAIPEHRQKLRRARPQIRPAAIPFRDMLVMANPNIYIPVRLYRPAGIRPPYPTLFYVSGTAFVASETAFTDVICSHIAEKSSCQVILIHHRLAPENPFPAALEDVCAAFIKIMRSSGPLFHIDRMRVAVGGYSSGGNLAASMVFYARKEGFPVARQILICPILDLSRSLTAYKAFENRDITITESFVGWFLGHYLSPHINRLDPRLSPFWRSLEECQGLPPADILVGKHDRFRSDAEGYHVKLSQAGVDSNILLMAGDHSLMWKSFEVFPVIGARMRAAFNLYSVPRPFSCRSVYARSGFFSHTCPPSVPEQEAENPKRVEYRRFLGP